jgi:hypothetical protein
MYFLLRAVLPGVYSRMNILPTNSKELSHAVSKICAECVNGLQGRGEIENSKEKRN